MLRREIRWHDAVCPSCGPLAGCASCGRVTRPLYIWPTQFAYQHNHRDAKRAEMLLCRLCEAADPCALAAFRGESTEGFPHTGAG